MRHRVSYRQRAHSPAKYQQSAEITRHATDLVSNKRLLQHAQSRRRRVSRLCTFCRQLCLPEIPHFQALVERTRNERVSSGREGNAVDGIFVSAQSFDLLACSRIPNAHDRIEASRRDEF
jgi:hypothetical protein